MPKPNCKDCSNFDGAYGLPGRCKLVMESIKHKILNNSATADELRYFVRTEELPDEYWQWICENFEQKGKRTNREALKKKQQSADKNPKNKDSDIKEKDGSK